MAQVTVKYGVGNSISLAKWETVGDILSDSSAQSMLGFGDNVEAYIDGNLVGSDYVLQGGDVVSLQVKAHTKG